MKRILNRAMDVLVAGPETWAQRDRKAVLAGIISIVKPILENGPGTSRVEQRPWHFGILWAICRHGQAVRLRWARGCAGVVGEALGVGQAQDATQYDRTRCDAMRYDGVAVQCNRGSSTSRHRGVSRTAVVLRTRTKRLRPAGSIRNPTARAGRP